MDSYTPDQVEIELKLAIPEATRAAVLAAVATRTAKRTRLQAVYFDTAARHLAQAGVALRMRREGEHWVQTLKANGDDHLQRLEDNVELPGVRRPALDPQRHAGTPAGDRLAEVLAEITAASRRSGKRGKKASAEEQGGNAEAVELVELVEQYRTDITRCHRLLRIPGGEVEIAFDQGHLIAGKSRLAVLEVEFELTRGPVDGLIALATRWANRHRLWLDTRSKAERGDLLARGLSVSPPTRATGLELARQCPADVAARALVGNCLAQILPNASAVAAAVHGDEHLHQLRVGMRRLRTALRLCESWTATPTVDWQAALATLFGRLGAARDQAVLEGELGPALGAAGAPWTGFAQSGDAVDDPVAVLREPATTALWLALQGFASGVATPNLEPSAVVAIGLPLRERSAAWLAGMFRQIRRDAGRFGSLDDESRHRLRRRLKRLRYGIEFTAALFDAKPVRQFLRPLAAAQEDLGRFNDLVVGLERMRQQAQTEPRAWFAVGWLSARRDAVIAECSVSLKRLGRAERFWRKG